MLAALSFILLCVLFKLPAVAMFLTAQHHPPHQCALLHSCLPAPAVLLNYSDGVALLWSQTVLLPTPAVFLDYSDGVALLWSHTVLLPAPAVFLLYSDGVDLLWSHTVLQPSGLLIMQIPDENVP